MTTGFHDRRYIITGAAQGIGFSVAESLVSLGAKVALVDINSDAVEQVSRELGSNALAFSADLTDESQVEEVVASAIRGLGGLDGLVNNAGIVLNGPAEQTSYADFRKVIDVNLSAVFLCARAAGRFLISQNDGGSIVNTASISAQVVVRPQEQVAYNASKAAVVGLTKTLAAEWAEFGIRVNSVSPGFTLTKLVQSEKLAPLHALWKKRIPLGRLAEVEDLTGSFEFLLSDKSAYITGHDLIVDGGYTLW
jgi:NAD(P)-dependent dehydrogenase (short-subunit alcohol dehydrogenase family)